MRTESESPPRPVDAGASRRAALASAFLGALLVPALASADGTVSDADLAQQIEAGRRLYQEGILPNGEPLVAIHRAGIKLRGKPAACANCHRRSGYGGYEGQSYVTAVVGSVLFAPGRYYDQPRLPGRMGRDSRLAPLRRDSRPAYDSASLDRSLREGVDPLDRPLSALMPLYYLDRPALDALIAYLRHLSAVPIPGVSDDALHLATIIAPGVAPEARKGVLDVLEAWFQERQGGRRWVLHVWELAGPAETWEAQLAERYRAQPVYAVLSGLGGGEWRPVHRFCEANSLPCLFPNVELAPVGGSDLYSMYFSSGVDLEARVLAKHLQPADGQDPPGRIVQVHSDFTGEQAAEVLRSALSETAIPVETRRFDATRAQAALAGLAPDDRLVLWLRPADLARLAAAAPQPPARRVYLSALLAEPAQVTLPTAWKAAVRYVTVFDEPMRQHGKANLSMLPWLKRFGLPLSDFRLQADTFAACHVLTDALLRMRGAMSREYLLETLESVVEAKAGIPLYPTLSLGPDQRYAVKGGGLLRYRWPEGSRPGPGGEPLVRDTPRIVP